MVGPLYTLGGALEERENPAMGGPKVLLKWHPPGGMELLRGLPGVPTYQSEGNTKGIPSGTACVWGPFRID